MSHAGDGAGGDADGCPGAGADHISGLPDHLLHDVLTRLPGTTASAARTGILSRRWRHVWTHLPVLSLDFCGLQLSSAGAARAVGRIDAALAAHAATAISRLEIAVPSTSSLHLPMDRVSAWLLFASQRVAGRLRIELPNRYTPRRAKDDDDEEEVLLPICERAPSMSFDLRMRVLRFPPPQHAGVFEALATLEIRLARIDAGELEAALSSRCPRLKELVLRCISLQDAGRDLSIRSGSLERLQISVGGGFDGRLHVDAPKLQVFHPYITADFIVLAPKLSEVRWGTNGGYDSTRHRLALAAGHQLRRLEVQADAPGAALMRQFNTVDELDLTVYLPRGVETYERFLEHTDKLAKCEVLVVTLAEMKHGFQPAMLHLLRKCAGIRRLVVKLRYSSSMNGYPCKLSSGCPCSRLESCETHNVVLDSLEEVVIDDHGGVDHKVELVRLLYRCRATFHKRVAITVLESGRIHHLRNKIQGICPPNDKVEITVRAT